MQVFMTAQLDEGGSNVLVKKLEILFEDSAREPISLDLTGILCFAVL